jgi:hypothetical protein
VLENGTERKGILAEVSVTSATLLVKGRREEVAEAATRRIVRENPDSLRNGARNGAIAGGVIIAAFLIPQAFHPGQSEVTVPSALIGAGFYVGTGGEHEERPITRFTTP